MICLSLIAIDYVKERTHVNLPTPLSRKQIKNLDKLNLENRVGARGQLSSKILRKCISYWDAFCSV